MEEREDIMVVVLSFVQDFKNEINLSECFLLEWVVVGVLFFVVFVIHKKVKYEKVI